VGEHLWRRKLLIAAVVVAATFALGSFVFARLQSNIGPGHPTFVMQISKSGAKGDFDAITANRGERPSVATCTVEAFDIYGNTIGTKEFDLGRLAPGEPLEWRGHVRVDARVERMSLDCR
jgi:hypothetical protein